MVWGCSLNLVSSLLQPYALHRVYLSSFLSLHGLMIEPSGLSLIAQSFGIRELNVVPCLFASLFSLFARMRCLQILSALSD